MKRLLLNIAFIYYAALTSCQPSYKMNKKYIKSSVGFDLEQGFIIEKIQVDSVYQEDAKSRMYKNEDGDYRSTPEKKKGFPVSFQVDTAVILQKKVDTRERKKIYFHQVNKGYYWVYWKPVSVQAKFAILPLQFIPGQWYHIRNLTGAFSSPSYHIFIYVKEDGRFSIYKEDKPGPF